MKKSILFAILLSIAFTNLKSQVIFEFQFTEDFENNPAWTIIDGDQLSPGEYLGSSGTIWVDPSWRYSSSWSCAMSNSRFTSPGKADNWMILPQMTLPDNIPYIKWQGRNVNEGNGKEEYEILISTTNNDTTSFTKIAIINEESPNYKDWAVDLSAYQGDNVYLAFRHVTYDAYLLCIDAIEVGGTESYDLGLVKSSVPEVVPVPTDINISQVEVINRGQNNITSFDLNWMMDEGEIHTTTFNNVNLEPFVGTTTVSHPDKPEISNVDSYTLKVWTSNLNGNNDQYPDNDTLTYIIGGISNIPVKHVLIEEGTGTWCSYCTDGAVRLKDILETVPNTIGVAIHSGDVMSNPDGDSLLYYYYAALPRGAVDRVKYDEYEDVGFSRGDWKTKTQQRTNEIVPAEVKISPVYDNDSRELTVDVSALFYGVFSEQYRLSVLVLEDSVTGGMEYNQSNGYDDEVGHPMYGLGNPIIGYVHNHVLRKILGGPWGIEGIIPSPTEDLGNYSHTFTFTIPEEWETENIKLIGVLQKYSPDPNDRAIVNSIEGIIDQFVSVNDVDDNQIQVYPNPSHGRINIKGENIAEISLFNSEGRLLYKGNKSYINANDFAPGIYMLKIATDNHITTRKIIINQ